MAIISMLPPSNGNLNSISFNGRTYSSVPGVPIPVPDFDAWVLQAHGWTSLPASASINTTTVTTTSGLAEPYYFQALVDPASPSTAVVLGLIGEAQYVAGASSISGGGHLIGVLGILTNKNTTQTLALGLAAEGRITNLTGTITTAVCGDFDLASNTGTITNWFGCYADVAGNAGTITLASGFTIQIDSNTGTIGTLAGFNFPTLNSPGTISGITYGFFFGNNPSISGTKYGVFINDANASIHTVGQIVTTSTLNLGSFTVATLPAGATGNMARISDATAPTYNVALTGGGAVSVPVYYNGSAWVSH
jgi:hypothetical protein